MSLHRGIHQPVEVPQFERILSDQMRCKLRDAGPDARCVGRQVKWSKRTDFAVPNETLVRFDPDDCTIKNVNGFSARPFVRTLMKRKVDLVGGESSNFHEVSLLE